MGTIKQKHVSLLILVTLWHGEHPNLRASLFSKRWIALKKRGSNSFEGWWRGGVSGASDGRLWNAALRPLPGERQQQCWTPFTSLPLQTYLDDKTGYWCSPEGESRRVFVDTLISHSRTLTLFGVPGFQATKSLSPLAERG